MTIRMQELNRATIDELPNITLTFAAQETDGLIEEILGILMHTAYSTA